MSTNAVAPWYDRARVQHRGSVVLQNWLAANGGHARAGLAVPRPATRSYAAAQVNRLTQGWSAVTSSANADIFRSLDVLRARSRGLALNDEYVKHWLRLVRTNVVGPGGFRFQAQVMLSPGVPDRLANQALEQGWTRFCAVADVTGRQNFTGMCQTAATTAARDGEILWQFVRGADAGNEFGLAIKALDVNRIDTNLNRPAGEGVTQIKMGVELNAYGRPIYYWLRVRNPGDVFNGAEGQILATHQRIPAADIIHAFIVDDPEQVRGVPWSHAAMLRLNNRGAYEEASIIAARTAAEKMGFFVSPNGDSSADPLATGEEGGGGGDSRLVIDSEAGGFQVVPEGYDFKAFDPSYPSDMFEPFIKANLRGTASGLGVAYHSLANDLEGVNFSSIRSGTLEERDSWMVIQDWLIASVLERVHPEVITAGLTFGQFVLANGSPLPASGRLRFMPHAFQGRRWEWVDPQRDINADILAMDKGLKSPQSIAAKLGTDLEDVLLEIQQAQAMRKQMGISDPSAKEAKPAAKPADQPTDEEEKP